MANGTDSMDDLWFVQLPNGTTRAWSLDQLDAEFQKGTIDERTLVRQGVAPWSTLGELLGLDDAPPAPPVLHPQMFRVPDAEQVPSSLSPFLLPSAPPPPVVTSLEDEIDFAPRRSRKGLVLGVMVAALAVCGGVFAFTGAGASPAAASAAQEVAPLPKPVAAPPPPAPAPAATQLDLPKGAPLTDLQRKALLEADKNREKASKDAKEKRAKLAPRKGAPKSASPFHKGGNKSDPLNSAL